MAIADQLKTERPLRMSFITFNNARGENQYFYKKPELVYGQVELNDVIVICCQEVPRNLKSKLMAEIEGYLSKFGFVNIE